MAQHNDLIIDDQTGSDFLPDLNSLFTAILTQNSGNDEPSATVPFMFWAEPDSDTLWQRNAANDGWVNKGKLSEGALDSAKILLRDESALLTKGFPITPTSYGNLSDNPTIDFTKPRGCTMVNNSSGAIGNPSGYGEQVVKITNGPNPGTPDISAMNLVSGVFSTTPNTGRTRIYIERYEDAPADVWLEVLS